MKENIIENNSVRRQRKKKGQMLAIFRNVYKDRSVMHIFSLISFEATQIIIVMTHSRQRLIAKYDSYSFSHLLFLFV